MSTGAWIVKRDLGAQIWMGAIGAPFMGLIVALALTSDFTKPLDVKSWLASGALCLFGIVLAAYIPTTRLELSESRLSLSRFGLTLWVIDRGSVELKQEGVGDLGNLPGYRVYDRQTGKRVGSVLAAQYDRSELDRLLALFPKHDQ